jgi:trehalose 6-phosphate phosphatase
MDRRTKASQIVLQFSSEAEISQAIDALVAAETLLIALDFDGTLSPEVDEPLDARAHPEAHEQLLRILELTDTRLALISGRALDSLEHVAKLPSGVLLSGSHGLEYRLDDGDSALGMSEENAAALLKLDALMHELAASAEGAWVELKPAGRTLHFRLSTPDDVARLEADAVDRVTAEIPGLTPRFGKNVVEFAIHAANKGDAINRLREYVGADAIFFAGDDTTDEDAIAELGEGDLGVRVGDVPSAAALRVAGTREFSEVLRVLVDRRAAAVVARTR